jgi:molecular chaperone GrpE
MAEKKQKADAAERKKASGEKKDAAETEKTEAFSPEHGDGNTEEVLQQESSRTSEGPADEESVLDILQKEFNTLKDQYLRKSADFDNYRKRMVREKQDSIRYANQDLLRDLIEVIDNFERAIKSSDDSQDFKSFRDGIAMIEQQFTTLLATKWGLKKIESEGREYDPVFHEAVMMDESDDYDKPVVVEDFQTGYQLHDRVIRPSKVKVGKPAQTAGAVSETGQEDPAELH